MHFIEGKPVIILYLLILLIPLQFHPILGMKLVGTFTIIKLVGAFSLLYALIYRMAGSGQRLLSSHISKLFCVFTLLSLASFIAFYDPYIPHAKYFGHISFFIFFIVVLTFIDSKEKLRKCLWVCVLAMVLGALTVIKGGIKYGWRPGGGFGDANIYAANAVLILPIAYYLFLSEKRYRTRMVLLGMMVLITAAFLLTQSRGGAGGLLVALLIMSWHSSKKLKAFLGVILLVIILLPFVPESFWARAGYFGYEQAPGARASSEAHRQRWIAGLNMIKEHPLLGVGLDNFYFSISKYNPLLEEMRRGGGQAHNGYIEITGELGIPVFCIYASMLVLTFLSLRSIKQTARINSDYTMLNLVRGIEAGLVGFLVCCFFVNAQYQKLFWLMVFLVIVLERIRPERVSPTLVYKPIRPLAVFKNKDIYSLTFKKRLLKEPYRVLLKDR